jgi:hypothetical protein
MRSGESARAAPDVGPDRFRPGPRLGSCADATRVTTEFVANDVQGQETYAIATNDITDQNSIWISGCDGGGGRCTPTIRNLGKNGTGVLCDSGHATCIVLCWRAWRSVLCTSAAVCVHSSRLLLFLTRAGPQSAPQCSWCWVSNTSSSRSSSRTSSHSPSPPRVRAQRGKRTCSVPLAAVNAPAAAPDEVPVAFLSHELSIVSAVFVTHARPRARSDGEGSSEPTARAGP